MSKLIIFDLDGVLVDSKCIHFYAFNYALSAHSNGYEISFSEHHNLYDGLSTKTKLELLSRKRGLPNELHESIWKTKQSETSKIINGIVLNE